jgi:hypothetical protein
MGNEIYLEDIINDEQSIDFKNIVLSDEHPTVLYIPYGRMPMAKAEAYMQRIQKRIKEFGEEYKVLLIGVPSP